MGNSKVSTNILGLFKANRTQEKQAGAKRGDIGYDSPRDNIDDHIVSQVIKVREGTIEKVPTNSKDIVNKAYADSLAPGGVTSVFTRTGAVVAASNDYTWAQVNKATSDIADITTKSHTSLTDIGTNTHAQIDTHIALATNPHGATLTQTTLNGTTINTSTLAATGQVSGANFGFTTGNKVSGSVLFVSGNLLMSENNSGLFWDNTNINLGIGTNAPIYGLHIKNSLNSTLTLEGNLPIIRFVDYTGNTKGILDVVQNAGQTASTSQPGDYAMRSLSGSILFATETTGIERMRISTSTGYVGIGTMSPATYLDISGSHVANIGLLRVMGVGGHGIVSIDTDTPTTKEAGIFFNKSGAIKWELYVPANRTDFVFWDGTADRITFQTGGNVGIGTTTPAGLLHVQGSTVLSGQILTNQTQANGSTTAAFGATSPGNASPQEWLKVTINGVLRYIPCF